MKLKYTIILLSLATPLAAEDCLQDKNQSLYEVISCLNKRGIENYKALRKDIQQLRKESKREIEKANALRKDIRQLESEKRSCPPKLYGCERRRF
jgi:hypothetical protein